MSQVAVIVDSCASIPPGVLEGEGIQMVPYYVHLEGQVYRDLVDLQPGDLAPVMRAITDASQAPKTANPGPGDYEMAYLQAAESAPAVLSFHMTSLGSGAYQAACIAREKVLERLKHVTIQPIDTRNVSMAHGWIALCAARLANAGADLAQVLDLVQRLTPLARMLQTADTLRYLYLGGRIGRAKHLIGSLLSIRPLITMEAGEIGVLGVARTRARALARIASAVHEQVDAPIRLALTHFEAAEEARQLADLVRAQVGVGEELVCELSPALCVHSGPGTVGLCYVPDLSP